MSRNIYVAVATVLTLINMSLTVWADDITSNTTSAQNESPSSVEQSRQIQGEVQVIKQPTTIQNLPEAVSAADYLDIQYKSGESKYQFQEYALVLQNKQPKYIEVLQVEVLNGLTEQAYLEMQQQKSQAKRRVAGGILRGLTGVATSFVPYAGIGSYAAYHAIGAGTNAAYVAANAMENSAGHADYTGRIMQRASNIMISPNQQFQCLAVVPEKQAPIIKVIFKDLQNNQIYDFQK